MNKETDKCSTADVKHIIKDARTLAMFVRVYCRRNHTGAEKAAFTYKGRNIDGLHLPALELCDDCTKLLNHGIAKRALCPMDPKPMCKKCPNHCYHPAYRDRMREVMKFSGIHLAKRGRLDMLIHYFA